MKYIDRDAFHFDFAINAISPGRLGNEMQRMGASFFPLPLRSQGLRAYRAALKKLLLFERYDAVHVHGNSVSFVDLQVAKSCRIPIRIAHAHATKYRSGLKDNVRQCAGQILNYHFATTVIGCGQKAGEDIFGKQHMRSKKALVLPNAIEIDRFKFDPVVREGVRDEFGLHGKYVLGMH